MARPNKIEQLKLQKVVADAVSKGMSTRAIAAECSRLSKEPISHVAVARYLEMVGNKKKEVRKQPERIAKIVNFDIDIISISYRTTAALLERFELLDNLPAMLEERFSELAARVDSEDGADPDYLHRWKIAFLDELRRNIGGITAVNRELRENTKFMAEMREKAFEFSLVQEYLLLFMEEFRSINAEAYDIVTQKIAANPRMQRIVEQQNQLRGEMAG